MSALVSGRVFRYGKLTYGVWIPTRRRRSPCFKMGIPFMSRAWRRSSKSNCGNSFLSLPTDIAEALRVAQISALLARGSAAGGRMAARMLRYVPRRWPQRRRKHGCGTCIAMDQSTPVAGGATAQKVRSAIQDPLGCRQQPRLRRWWPVRVLKRKAAPPFTTATAGDGSSGGCGERAGGQGHALSCPILEARKPDHGWTLLRPEATRVHRQQHAGTRSSFANRIANICELVGADVNEVRSLASGATAVSAISSSNPGCGYGGGCFQGRPRETLIRTLASQERLHPVSCRRWRT